MKLISFVTNDRSMLFTDDLQHIATIYRNDGGDYELWRGGHISKLWWDTHKVPFLWRSREAAEIIAAGLAAEWIAYLKSRNLGSY